MPLRLGSGPAGPMMWDAVLPLVLCGLMGIAVFVYAILDGFDLGTGILLPFASRSERQTMIEAIGPFWDANEMWLVLAAAILLLAFPSVADLASPSLLLSVFVMFAGLLLRAAAFAVRSRTKPVRRRASEGLFFVGSGVAALAQGWILGKYVIGLREGFAADLFAFVVALCLGGGYAALGAAWTLYKTHGPLQEKATLWLRRSLAPGAAGLAAVSLAMPLSSPRIYDKWLSWPDIGLMAPLPIACAALLGWLFFLSYRLPDQGDRHSLKPFLYLVLLFALAFAGLCYSVWPHIMPLQSTIREAAAPAATLMPVTAGAIVMALLISGCTWLAYRTQRGKVVVPDA